MSAKKRRFPWIFLIVVLVTLGIGGWFGLAFSGGGRRGGSRLLFSLWFLGLLHAERVARGDRDADREGLRDTEYVIFRGELGG